MVNLKLDNLSEQVRGELKNLVEQFRLGIDAVVNRQDDRWKLVEQRLDMGTREQNQSIRLLTTMAEKTEKDYENLDAEVDELKRGHGLVEKQVEDIRGTLQWISRAVLGMLISMVGSLVVGAVLYVATH